MGPNLTREFMLLRHAIQVSRAPIAALMAVGVFWGGFSSLVPDIKATVGASDRQLGMALVMSAIGGMGATYLVPRLGQILGRYAIPVVALFLVAAFFYLQAVGSVAALAGALFFAGASVAMLDITSNVRISALESRHGLHLMNVNHAMFSFAFAGAAFATGLARQKGLSSEQIMPALAVIVAILIIPMCESRAAYGTANSDSDEPHDGIRPPWTAIILTSIILFAAFVGENATEAWSALHIERTLGGAPGEGGYGPTMLGIMMGLGRLSGQFISQKFGEARLIFWSAILGVVGAIAIGAAPTQAAALVGVAIVGLGMAVIVPSVNSILGRLVREDQRSHAISRAWMFGMLGFFIGPSAMGFISEIYGLRVSFFAISVVIALMIPTVVALGKQERR